MFYKFLIGLVCFSISLVASSDIRNLETFKANFTQVITSSTNNIIEYKGEVFIKKSGKILWKYKTPVVKNVYIINDSAIVDEPELEQAIYTELDSEINIIKLLNNAKKSSDNNYSTNIDDVVLDPFMGSGTTARACVNLERKYIGFEIDQRQVDFANNELKNMSRQLSLF